MVKCTILTIYNKEDIYRGFIENLNMQMNIDYQLISINNVYGQYSGARQAYMKYSSYADTELLLFMHPDIRFTNKKALSNLVQSIDEISIFGVVGIVGCIPGKKTETYSNIVHGKRKQPAGKKLERTVKVQTVDECLFAIKKETLKDVPFSKLDGWHLYAVEQCIRLAEFGLNTYVVPADIYHISDGQSLDSSYFDTLKQIRKCFGGEIRYLNTTVKQWKLVGLRSFLYQLYYYYKQKVKRWIMVK